MRFLTALSVQLLYEYVLLSSNFRIQWFAKPNGILATIVIMVREDICRRFVFVTVYTAGAITQALFSQKRNSRFCAQSAICKLSILKLFINGINFKIVNRKKTLSPIQ